MKPIKFEVWTECWDGGNDWDNEVEFEFDSEHSTEESAKARAQLLYSRGVRSTRIFKDTDLNKTKGGI